MRTPQSAGGETTECELMARSLMYLMAAGATLLLASTALPQSPGYEESRIATTIWSSYGIAAILFLGFDGLPRWTFHVFLACATMLIEWAIFASGDSTSAYAMFYFWIAIYAFYFFKPAEAIAQILFIAAAYAAVLGFVPDPTSTPVLRWLTTTSALVVAGALIGLLKHRVDGLMSSLAESSSTDVLTGVVNRPGFQEALETEVERASRADGVLSLVVCDVDGFDEVNERLGFEAGDRLLRRLGAVLSSTKRRIDVLGRLGGDEFAVLAPDTDQHGAYILAERYRRAVLDAFEEEGVTVSVGIASFPKHGGTADGLVAVANQAVYAANQLSGNRVVIYHPEVIGALSVAAGRRDSQREQHLATLLALAEVLDVRDAGTAAHSQTVGRYAWAIARELELDDELVERLRLGGIVHDVGKIGIPDAVLRKPGPLSEVERAEMRRHAEIGARLLDRPDLEDISGWVLAHHERPDGSGYPYGLSADQVPLGAKILAVADAYEAMTSDRVYRPGLEPGAAQAELRLRAGTQFDTAVVTAFLHVLEREQPAVAPPVFAGRPHVPAR